MADEALGRYVLVGGTSLALQLGHRLSIDLDMFTAEAFDSRGLGEHLDQHYDWRANKIGPNLLMGFVGEVKVDFVRHNYPWIRPVLNEEGVRLASVLDIAAMKFNAIAHSRQRQKDYYDMYTLLEHHCVDEMVGAYVEKYPSSNRMIGLRSLTYFDDIDFDREPALMAEPVDFGAVRERLRQAVLEPFRTFP